jgi:hypothetical protein
MHSGDEEQAESAPPTEGDWSERVAADAVDGLVTQGLLRSEDFQAAVEVVAEEIRVRLCLGDVPTEEDRSSGGEEGG